jgi:hypothetical protein
MVHFNYYLSVCAVFICSINVRFVAFSRFFLDTAAALSFQEGNGL